VAVGDWIVGDYDGVSVVPGGLIETILEAGRAREQKEKVMFEKLRAGSTTVELLDLDPSPVEVADL
jgi:4-hydroxy-4-methyl-2-oxoglutarate aldolase